MAGRTHAQHALPITFGFKCALWLAPLQRHSARLARLSREIAVVQFGGAVGTLASLGADGIRVMAALAAELGLARRRSPGTSAATAWQRSRASSAC